jgi:hypothetical protein
MLFDKGQTRANSIGGWRMTSQIVPVIVVHELSMFVWVIFCFSQSILILAGNRRLPPSLVLRELFADRHRAYNFVGQFPS